MMVRIGGGLRPRLVRRLLGIVCRVVAMLPVTLTVGHPAMMPQNGPAAMAKDLQHVAHRPVKHISLSEPSPNATTQRTLRATSDLARNTAAMPALALCTPLKLAP